jgi:hypothetical protein
MLRLRLGYHRSIGQKADSEGPVPVRHRGWRKNNAALRRARFEAGVARKPEASVHCASVAVTLQAARYCRLMAAMACSGRRGRTGSWKVGDVRVGVQSKTGGACTTPDLKRKPNEHRRTENRHQGGRRLQLERPTRRLYG